MNGNIDRIEVIKCVDKIIGKNNLFEEFPEFPNPNVTDNYVIIKVKKSVLPEKIPELRKDIADCIEKLVSKPYGVYINQEQ